MTDQAYLKIKQMIMSNMLRPRQVLKESVLAKDRDFCFHTSTFSNSLSINPLSFTWQNEKFIENEPGRGTKVSPLAESGDASHL